MKFNNIKKTIILLLITTISFSQKRPIVYNQGKQNLVPGYSGSIPRKGFIFAGQSNVDGYQFVVPGSTPGLESYYQHAFSGTLFYQYSATNNVKFVPLNYADNTTYQTPNQTSRYALQFYLYTKLDSLYTDAIYFTHHAQGGTSLAVDWLSTTVGGLYSTLVFKVKASINAIKDADGQNPNFIFFYWGQGEDDAANLSFANAYQTNLTNLINNFRTDTGLTNIPIFIGRLNVNNNATTYPYIATVRAAQTAVCQGGGSAISGVYLVDQDNAELDLGGPHYTRGGYHTISQNIITKAESLGLIP